MLKSGCRIRYFSRLASRLPPRLFSWVFIPCDVVCLLFQGAGVDMALAGLSIQVIVMVVFCGLFADYLIRYFRAGRTERFGRRAQLFFSFMALAILLILTRCTYRLFELRDGYRSGAIRNESYFIALEGG
ncbi:uncharacterized protein PG986_009627 [Apiospora aurea]|uniref:Uncharacterized protein n=1 Tax=Apiospora aurea TaxID=335848 RepID=A0ABR1Q876_9PEZI